MKQFVLSDESLNSYGFKVLTNGIEVDNFMKNPVMYYNHERYTGVIGKWEGIIKEDSKLLGTPVFDEKDSLGAKIAGKVRDGFIRAASIGISNPVFEEINKEKVVTTCTLVECSVCDIPSNKNALILYHDDKPVLGKKEFLKLYKNEKIMKLNLKTITDALEISPNASLEDIVTAIGILKNTGSVNSLIDEAIKNNIIAKFERNELLQLATASPVAFKKYLEKRRELELNDREESGLKLVNEAIREGKINAQAKSFWLKNFMVDFDGSKFALEQIPKRVSISELIEKSRKTEKTKENWTLADYRKKAPRELKENPKLYRELLDREKAEFRK